MQLAYCLWDPHYLYWGCAVHLDAPIIIRVQKYVRDKFVAHCNSADMGIYIYHMYFMHDKSTCV